MSDFETRIGKTVEGYPYYLILEFPPEASVGANAIRITGHYQASDGAGLLDVSSWDDLPWVITAGEHPWF